MVGCQKLLSSDLEGQESLTSLSGHKIKITVNEVLPFAVPFVRMSLFLSSEGAVAVAGAGCTGLSRSPLSQNSITLNEEATVLTSDIVGVNGVIHFINKILIPSDLLGQNISKLSQVRLELCPALRALLRDRISLPSELPQPKAAWAALPPCPCLSRGYLRPQIWLVKVTAFVGYLEHKEPFLFMREQFWM